MPEYKYTQDPEFLQAPEEEKRMFLMETDPDFKAASPEDQRAYLTHLQSLQPSLIQRGFEAVRGPAVEQVAKPFYKPGEAIAGLIGRARGETPEQEAAGAAAGRQAGETMADIALPASPAELGADIALGGAGRLANIGLRGTGLLRRGARLGARVGGAAGGGYAGAELAGEEDPEGAAWRTAGGALGGEVVGTIGGFLARRMPGRQRMMSADYQRRVGAAVNEIIPEFGTIRTGDDFARMALEAKSVRTGGGALGEILDKADDQVRKALGKKTLDIPQTTTLGLPGPKTPAGPAGVAGGVMKKRYTSQLTYDQATAQLQSLHRKAYTAEAAKKTELAEQAREQAAELRKAIVEQLELKASPKIAAAWDVSRRKYAQGLELAREVKKALTPGFEGAYLDEPTLQQVAFKRLENAKQSFRREIDNLDEWHKVVTRGTKIGRVSELPGPSPTPGLYMTPTGRVSGFIRMGGLTQPGRYLGEKETATTGRFISDFLGIKAAERRKKEE